ncbi:MAG: deoxyribodipyrimidine photo-lyase [Clostridiaceae bacterium]
MIQSERVKMLNQEEIQNKPYVIYWMQSSQRTQYNHALEFAVDYANLLEKPLIVYFGLTEKFPEANRRHLRFMIEGLLEVKENLKRRGIRFIVMHCSPEVGAIKLAKEAALLVTDRGYLRIEKSWRRALADNAHCKVFQVESNVLVPVEVASMKEEYSAATIRRKIEKRMEEFALPLMERTLNYPSTHLEMQENEILFEDARKILQALDLTDEVSEVKSFVGGAKEANKHFEDFLLNKLKHYAKYRNEPSMDYTSNLSPYLHFGQVSPLELYLRLPEGFDENKRVFIDELIVRRELAINFVEYQKHYDSYDSISSFAKVTLEKHRDDIRPWHYTLEQLEKGLTHDPYWNAAEMEMLATGKMNGYMRMYWGKKIIEWTETPESAYEIALYLNNKYNIDGRDPSGFAGVAWCFGKHDRPWKEREVFGTVRYMNDKGLKRKFDMEAYLEKVKLMISKEEKIENTENFK